MTATETAQILHLDGLEFNNTNLQNFLDKIEDEIYDIN